MLPGLASSALGWAVPAVLGACTGWLAKGARMLRRRRRELEERDQALRDGMTSLLRAELVRAYELVVVQGHSASMDMVEFVQRTYASYHQLGGNDMGTRLYEEVMACVISHRDAGPS